MSVSGKVHIELNEAGVRELLKSPEIQAACMEQAQRMASKAGDGYTADVRAGRNRAVARASAATEAALKDNLKNNTLLKVM